jgi:hypothetical protein
VASPSFGPIGDSLIRVKKGALSSWFLLFTTPAWTKRMAAEFVAKTPILADAVKDLTGFYQQLAAPTTPAVRTCARISFICFKLQITIYFNQSL